MWAVTEQAHHVYTLATDSSFCVTFSALPDGLTYSPTYYLQRFDALLDSLRVFNAQQGHSRVPQTFRMPHIARPLDEQSTPGRSPRYSRVRALPELDRCARGGAVAPPLLGVPARLARARRA